MLTAKGMKGGEVALESSFAVSAAAFGRIPEIRFLQRSGFEKDEPMCDWITIGYFS
jgi:hypothetical protein